MAGIDGVAGRGGGGVALRSTVSAASAAASRPIRPGRSPHDSLSSFLTAPCSSFANEASVLSRSPALQAFAQRPAVSTALPRSSPASLWAPSRHFASSGLAPSRRGASAPPRIRSPSSPISRTQAPWKRVASSAGERA